MKNAKNVMNTIPLTFDEHQIKRSVIGGNSLKDSNTLNISVIVLNSQGSFYKMQMFENLCSCNFASIISVEPNAQSTYIDEVNKKFPKVKTIVPLEETSDGELINLAMEDVNSDFVLVLRDSLSIPNGFILPNLAERLTQTDCLCLVPRYFDVNKASVPTHFIPFVEKTHFKVEQNNLVGDGLKTLYPYDFMGFYNRKKFIELGGFDYTIKTPYWQLLDFALRSWLWGEKIQLSTLFQFNYAYECPLEDHTINLDYLKYHLKNEAPKIKMGAGIIKKTAFWGFYNHSACGILEAKRMFDAARLWVKQNRYRFKMDLQTFIDEWNKNENK